MDLLEAQADRGKTIVATTHDLATASQRFEQVLAVNRTVVAYGPAKILLDADVLAARVRRPPPPARRADRRPRRRAPPRRRGARRAPLPRSRSLMDLILEPLGTTIFIRALIASALVGIVCAVVGTYVVLRGIAFIGDAIAHAGFPGVVAAYMIGIPFYLGAAVAAVSHGARDRVGHEARGDPPGHRDRRAVRRDLRPRRVPVQHDRRATSRTCSASCWATSSRSGPRTSSRWSSSAAASCSSVALLWKELLYATFDPLGAAASGIPVDRLEYLFLALVALTIVVSLQAVGIILVVAMLVTPAATAQLVTVRFTRLMLARGAGRHRQLDRRAVPVLLARRRQRRHDRPRPDRHVPRRARVRAARPARPAPRTRPTWRWTSSRRRRGHDRRHRPQANGLVGALGAMPATG